MTLRTSPRCAGGTTTLPSTVADTASTPIVHPREDASSPQDTTQPKTHPKRGPQPGAGKQIIIETAQSLNPGCTRTGPLAS